jgi:hypothetical protein
MVLLPLRIPTKRDGERYLRHGTTFSATPPLAGHPRALRDLSPTGRLTVPRAGRGLATSGFSRGALSLGGGVFGLKLQRPVVGYFRISGSANLT